MRAFTKRQSLKMEDGKWTTEKFCFHRFRFHFLMIFAALLFGDIRATAAHDGWVEVTPSIVEKNQPAAIALLQGNHSNEHRSYRIAGKWDRKYTTLAVFDSKGTPSTLTERIIDMDEDEEKIGPKGPKGFYLA